MTKTIVSIKRRYPSGKPGTTVSELIEYNDGSYVLTDEIKKYNGKPILNYHKYLEHWDILNLQNGKKYGIHNLNGPAIVNVSVASHYEYKLSCEQSGQTILKLREPNDSFLKLKLHDEWWFYGERISNEWIRDYIQDSYNITDLERALIEITFN